MVNAVRQVGQNKVPEESDATPKAAFLSNCKLFDLEAVLIQSVPNISPQWLGRQFLSRLCGMSFIWFRNAANYTSLSMSAIVALVMQKGFDHKSLVLASRSAGDV
jgi:hypothetical protein